MYDDTRGILAYRNNSTSNNLYVHVFTISGTVITVVKPVQPTIVTMYATDLTAIWLNSTTVFLCYHYQNGGAGNPLSIRGVLLTISSDNLTITAGTPTELRRIVLSSVRIKAVRLSETKILLISIHSDEPGGQYEGYTSVCSISGSAITNTTWRLPGTYTGMTDCRAVKMTDTTVAVFYTAVSTTVSNEYFYRARVISITGTMVTYGSVLSIFTYPVIVLTMAITAISASTVLAHIVMTEYGTTYHLVRRFEISGTTIAAGWNLAMATFTHDTLYFYSLSVAKLSDTYAMIGWCDYTPTIATYKRNLQVVDISGYQLQADSAIQSAIAMSTNAFQLTPLDADRCLFIGIDTASPLPCGQVLVG